MLKFIKLIIFDIFVYLFEKQPETSLIHSFIRKFLREKYVLSPRGSVLSNLGRGACPSF